MPLMDIWNAYSRLKIEEEYIKETCLNLLNRLFPSQIYLTIQIFTLPPQHLLEHILANSILIDFWHLKESLTG